MRILAPIEQEIRRAIRDARANDPLISVVGLQDKLERQFNREFSRAYLAKLTHKVARETLVEIDRAKIEQRIAFTRENYGGASEDCLLGPGDRDSRTASASDARPRGSRQERRHARPRNPQG